MSYSGTVVYIRGILPPHAYSMVYIRHYGYRFIPKVAERGYSFLHLPAAVTATEAQSELGTPFLLLPSHMYQYYVLCTSTPPISCICRVG